MVFTVTGQRLTLQHSPEPILPNAFCNAEFSFDQTWGYTSVWANLEGCGVCYRMKIENGMITGDYCTYLPKGQWAVYLNGERYNENGELLEKRITNICYFIVDSTQEEEYRYRTISTPTPMEQTKFLALQALDLSREVMRMAQAGDFNGVQGDSGQDGTDGYSPVRGTDYWTASDIAVIKGYVDEAIPTDAYINALIDAKINALDASEVSY